MSVGAQAEATTQDRRLLAPSLPCPVPRSLPLPGGCRRGIRLRATGNYDFWPWTKIEKRNQHQRHRGSKAVGHVITGSRDRKRPIAVRNGQLAL